MFLFAAIRPHKLLHSPVAEASLRAAPSSPPPPPPFLAGAGADLRALASRTTTSLVASAAAAIIALSSPAAPALAAADFSTPVVDQARVLPSGRVIEVRNSLSRLEELTGFQVRVFTKFGGVDDATAAEIRSGWGVGEKTVVVLVDPSAPNILVFKWGKQINPLLPRAFFTELSSRFGNVFNVREEGDAGAVLAAVAALEDCLTRDGGCAVVPGLPRDQYVFTLVTSLAGGLVCGSALRIEPQGFVRQQWVWAVLFFPLWGILFASFGLGPVLTRTNDVAPVAGNTAAFLACMAAVLFQDKIARAVGLTAPQAEEEQG